MQSEAIAGKSKSESLEQNREMYNKKMKEQQKANTMSAAATR